MSRFLSEEELHRTVWLFGRPYHWTIRDERLELDPGPSERDQVRRAARDMLLTKGVEPHTISDEMVDNVVKKAEAAAIMKAVTDD